MYKTVESRWGTTKFFAHDEYVGKSLYYYGEYGPDETEKILELCGNIGDRCVLDVGANIGTISQALLHQGHTVYAIEPQPEVFKLLQINMAATGSSKAYAYNYAVGSEEGVAQMPKVHYSVKGNFGGLGIGQKSIYGNIEVLVKKLDSLITSQRVGFIKMDVEGSEIHALIGCARIITRDNPIMYIEDDRPSNSSELHKLIRDLGYSIQFHKPALFRPNNHFNNPKNVWAPSNFASSNLICIPNADSK